METIVQLNETQLAQLKAFIQKRGMREPDVVNEILDHFACKIEELIMQEPQMPFDRAMEFAHKSFGKSGFRPITKAYEETLDKVIWSTYKNSIKSVFKSPSILFVLISSILSFYLLPLIPEALKKNWLFGIHFWVSLIPALAFVTSSILYSYKTKRNLFRHWRKKDKLNLWEIKSMAVQSHIFMIIGTIIFPSIHSDKSVTTAYFIVASVICFLSFINALAQYKTMMKMQEKFGSKKQLI